MSDVERILADEELLALLLQLQVILHDSCEIWTLEELNKALNVNFKIIDQINRIKIYYYKD